MNAQYLKLTVEDRVATVLINRPEKGNSMSPQMLTEIGDMFIHLDSRQDVTVIVFTGGEKFFCAGFDLDIIRNLAVDSNRDFVALYNRAYRAIRFCSQPVLAAIGGPAVAGGFDLTQMCDVRYASERARFSQREVVISLIPVLDPLWRIIGLGNALEWALTGRMIDAHEAHRVGFVSRIVPEGRVVQEVSVIAREMASLERACLVETKKLGQYVTNNTVDGSLKMHEWLFRSYIGSDENKTRIDSLLDSIRSKKK